MFCSKCGTQNDNAATFCNQCGANMIELADSSAQSQQSTMPGYGQAQPTPSYDQPALKQGYNRPADTPGYEQPPAISDYGQSQPIHDYVHPPPAPGYLHQVPTFEHLSKYGVKPYRKPIAQASVVYKTLTIIISGVVILSFLYFFSLISISKFYELVFSTLRMQGRFHPSSFGNVVTPFGIIVSCVLAIAIFPLIILNIMSVIQWIVKQRRASLFATIVLLINAVFSLLNLSYPYYITGSFIGRQFPFRFPIITGFMIIINMLCLAALLLRQKATIQKVM